MEKQILLDQLDDRIKRALALFISIYPKLRDGKAEIEEARGLLEITDGIKCFVNTIYDIQYNNNIHKYKNEIYGIAKGEFNE
jgi:hypothetical protein